ncbi:MAG: exonuclease SbcCD subunit D [Chloroflexales bacterium]|nr:exonuclease SbcCD subunit D [Chloroflexales bacterium]
MRLLHTADWHLGRVLHGVQLLEDQAYILAQLIAIARETRPDAVIIAGDIYDRAIPSGPAIDLLDQTLSEIVLDLRVPVVLIAGNHDGPQWVNFGSRLHQAAGLHLFGALRTEPGRVTLHDQHGPVIIYAMPYADPGTARTRLGETAITSHDEAMACWAGRVGACHPAGTRSVAVAHAFVAGGLTCKSERDLAVGGAGSVAAGHFTPFHYTALGHLHRPQAVGEVRIRYAGSPLKYSISEIEHAKSVTVVELDAAGACTHELIALRPRRDLRRVEGAFDALLRGEVAFGPREDYVVVKLTDQETVVEGMSRLRQIFPNIIHLERPQLLTSGDVRRLMAPESTLRDDELFAEFYRALTNTDLSPEHARVFAEIVQNMQIEEREGELCDR